MQTCKSNITSSPPLKPVFHKERPFVKSLMRMENRFANIFVRKWRDLKTFSWNFNFNFAATTSLSIPSLIKTSLLNISLLLSFLLRISTCEHGGFSIHPSSSLPLLFQGDSFNKILLQHLKYQSCQSRKEKSEFFLISCFDICIFLEVNNLYLEFYLFQSHPYLI